MYNPMTTSCITSDLEKQIVLRTNLLIRVLNVRFFVQFSECSLCQLGADVGLTYVHMLPNHQCKICVLPNGSSKVLSLRKTLSVRSPKTYASTFPVACSIACHSHRWFSLFCTKQGKRILIFSRLR